LWGKKTTKNPPTKNKKPTKTPFSYVGKIAVIAELCGEQ
jgi:hypothetical protein